MRRQALFPQNPRAERLLKLCLSARSCIMLLSCLAILQSSEAHSQGRPKRKYV
jgi:hypothetical protein